MISFILYWTQTFFKGIALFKSSSEKDACFSCERCKSWICGNCFPKSQFLVFYSCQGSTLRAIQNNLNRYDDWLCVWRE
ncbi:hypothetical protein BpHYR1_016701 [Brachionus plicatilis]|uniref:Uncharacterized protein n=1 Tax=Brachionus plicatilis TaxID=10195 RepID=A0A3M7RH80_BRAPC|nr:hypothetical protein BpHYR1_016701 [Brachionus plicatilis]